MPIAAGSIASLSAAANGDGRCFNPQPCSSAGAGLPAPTTSACRLCGAPGWIPRWCVGFSDCSALLLAQWAAGSMGGIHAWFGADGAAWQRLVDLLEHRPTQPLRGEGVQGGVAEGPLVVTNLTIATSLIGTPWLPSLKGAILVLDDTVEAPYRIDRQLTQWRASGLLPGDFSMDEILLERLAPLGVPLVRHLPLGHGQPNQPLLLGRRARLDGVSGALSLLA